MREDLITHLPGDGSDKAPALRPPITEVRIQTRIPWTRVGWMASLFVMLGLAVHVASQVRTVTIPMLVACTVAYVLNPLVDFLAGRGMGRTTAIFILLFLSLVGTAAWAVLIVPVIWSELSQVPQKLQEVLAQARPWIEHTFRVSLPTDIEAVIQALQDELLDRSAGTDVRVAGLAHRISGVLRVVFGGTVSVLAPLGGLIMLPFFVFYLLRDYHVIVEGLQSLVPLPQRGAVLARLREIDITLNAFLRGQLMVGTILAVIYAVGFTLVGLPLGLILGLTTGLGNMVPYVGTAFGLTAATGLVLLSWSGWGHLAAVYAVFAVGHALESWLITPRIVGNRVGLSPFFVIVAVLVFGELFGFFGVLVAVPVTAILRILLRVAMEHYRASSFYIGDLAQPPQSRQARRE